MALRELELRRIVTDATQNLRRIYNTLPDTFNQTKLTQITQLHNHS